MLNKSSRFYPFLIVAVLSGLAAGVCGEILTRTYIFKDYSIPYLSSDLDLSNLSNNRSNLIIRDAKKVVVNQDVKIEETLGSIRPALVGFFKVIASSSEENLKPDYYKLDEPMLSALMITADGWALASVPTDLKGDLNIKNLVAISSEKKIYKIDQVAEVKNLPGDLVFFHLAGSPNFPVKKIVPRSELALGQAVLAVKGFNSAFLSSLSSLQKTPAVLSSDSLNARLDLANNLNNKLENSFVFNLAGDLVAVVGADSVVVPAFAYNQYWQSLLKKAKISQPFLGVNYLDLSQIKTLDITLDKGAWLYPAATLPAIIKNSPAALAGLKEGDIITWVNNQEIRAGLDLADIIATFSPSEVITLTYLREGLEKEVEITLTELK